MDMPLSLVLLCLAVAVCWVGDRFYLRRKWEERHGHPHDEEEDDASE